MVVHRGGLCTGSLERAGCSTITMTCHRYSFRHRYCVFVPAALNLSLPCLCVLSLFPTAGPRPCYHAVSADPLKIGDRADSGRLDRCDGHLPFFSSLDPQCKHRTTTQICLSNLGSKRACRSWPARHICTYMIMYEPYDGHLNPMMYPSGTSVALTHDQEGSCPSKPGEQCSRSADPLMSEKCWSGWAQINAIS